MPKVMPRTPETEKAMEYSVPNMIMELAKKVVQDTKKGVKKKAEKRKYTDEELLELAMAGLGGAIRIKGPKAVRRAIRDQIKKELKARGEPDVKNWVDRVLRGTWMHGRSTYPKPGESYTSSRFRPGNLGEPSGMSLTAQPELLKYHFAKPDPKYHHAAQRLSNLQQKLDSIRSKEILADSKIQSKMRERDRLQAVRMNLENPAMHEDLYKRGHKISLDIQKLSEPYYEKYKPLFAKIDKAQTWLHSQQNKPPVARVMPKFGGPPAEKTLLGWKASRTIPSQQVLQDVYKKALTKQPQIWKDNLSDELSPGAYSIVEDIYKKYGSLNKTTLNEYYAKTSNPNVRYFRKEISDLVNKLPGHISSQPTHLFSDWRNKINYAKFNQDISDELLSRGYKSLLYSPYRFEEWELRMLDPSDVLHIDMRKVDDPALRRMLGAISKNPYSVTQQYGMPTGFRGRSLRNWAARTENFPHSLRNIYQDMDLPVAGVKKPTHYSPEVEELIKVAKAKVAKKEADSIAEALAELPDLAE